MDELNNLNAASSDVEIVRQIQAGDKNAYNLLVIKYQHKIIQVILKFIPNNADANDVAQEAFIKAYRSIGNFRGDSSFYTWLYRIAVNAAKTYLESNQKYQGALDVDAEDFDYKDSEGVLTSKDTPDRIIESEELQAVIQKAIQNLPEDQKQALLLREVEGMSYDDIAVVMKIPVGTVRSRIFRAREYVEKQMASLTA
ncbi:MAG: RNA polymerase sigma factor RpoE [Succinivibrio sp.]|nr:RNA polymerase sigma factor RpoE [Succinivibrio sp.]